MKLDTFITNYMTDGSKDKYIKSIIKSDYVAYATKCSDCERIVRSCHYIDVDGNRRFSMNSPAQAMMFALLLVDRYTKIDIEYSVDVFDELQKCGALGMIVGMIPEAEHQEYSAIMNMTIDDVVMRETSVAFRLDDLIQAAFSIVDSYAKEIERLVGQENNNAKNMGSD